MEQSRRAATKSHQEENIESCQLRNILLPSNYRTKIIFLPWESRLPSYETLPWLNGQRHWVLRFLRHHKFKADASTSFDISAKLQIGFVGKGREIHRTTLANQCNNLEKCLYQFLQIHVSILTNPRNNFDKSMYQFCWIHVTTRAENIDRNARSRKF